MLFLWYFYVIKIYCSYYFKICYCSKRQLSHQSHIFIVNYKIFILFIKTQHLPFSYTQNPLQPANKKYT